MHPRVSLPVCAADLAPEERVIGRVWNRRTSAVAFLRKQGEGEGRGWASGCLNDVCFDHAEERASIFIVIFRF